MSNIIEVTKTLAAASSTGIGTISSASPAVATLNTSSLDTGRRISIWSTGSTLAGFTFTVIGIREGGGPMRETITGPTSNVAVATTQDFLSVSSILPSSSPLTNVATVGTNTQGGTVWQSVNVFTNPVQLGANLTFSSTANGTLASIEVTGDNPFQDPNGYVPGGIPNDLEVVPISFTSTAFSSVSGNTWESLNIVGPGSGQMVPIRAWRLTITSSSTSATTTVNVDALQAGVG